MLYAALQCLFDLCHSKSRYATPAMLPMTYPADILATRAHAYTHHVRASLACADVLNVMPRVAGARGGCIAVGYFWYAPYEL